MKGHQKYFPTRAQTGELTNRFIIVSNIESKDESQVIAGNQRVIRARLSDAKFFYDTDRKHTLRSRRDRLDKITFHPKLGSLGAKTERLKNSLGANCKIYRSRRKNYASSSRALTMRLGIGDGT